MNSEILKAQADANCIVSMEIETIESCPSKTYSAAEVLEFIAAECERCAKIAEDFSFTDYREIPGYGSVVDESKSLKRLASEIRGVCGMCEGAGRYTKHGGEFNAEYNPYRQCHRCSGSGRRTE